MEVLTHGSFDEGPIILALPPFMEYEGLTSETDPIFNSWNKSTGITISKSQITDISDIFTTDGADGTTNISTVATGSNTGDQDLTGLVPYTGATGNVDLGVHTLDTERVYVNQETPISSTELATKGYVDNLVFNSTGAVTPTVVHNDTTGKEGGGGGHWYHMSATTNAIIPNITESGSNIVPLDLHLIDSGVSIGLDGLTWISLGWTAIVSDTFARYQIEYKKASYSVYSTLTPSSNTILIEGLTPNTSYNFRVSSVNRYGTMSAFSADLTLTTPSDTTAPVTVSNVTATGAIQAILLKWTHNTDIDLSSYNIYRSVTNSNPIKVANCTGDVYMDNGLTPNTTYYYWLKALDTSDNESSSFSPVCYATTRNVTASDVENIAAGQVIIQGVTTLSNWVSPGVTTIDGSKITTDTITLGQLNFTPVTDGNIIASITANEQGIQINADNFALSGASVFTSKVGGSFTSANSVPRIRIFPDNNIGIEVVDELNHNVFKAEVGGDNIGDVTIGNWAGNQGILYDKSANGGTGSTSFAGTVLASAGTIGGWSITPTGLVKDTGVNSTSSGMASGDYAFYAGATYDNRGLAPLRITSDGTLRALGYSVLGSTAVRNLHIGGGTSDDVADDNLVVEGSVTIKGTIDATNSTDINLSRKHNIAVGSTDITCSASETDMNAMSITITPKGNKLFMMFSAPFYVSSANQTLNLYFNVAGSDDRHTTTYISSGFQAVSFQHIATVTPNTTVTIKVKWLGSTAIQQRGSTDAERVLTVIDLM